jgi:EAL domain-containing protein (putative c-di-GMP-specific phosphodiesterase class I)
MHIAAHDRLALESDLRGAIARGELFVVYQPILDLETNEIVKVEALLRWQHATRGLVPPTEFIQLAEESGLIVEIGREILARACADASTWPGNVGISVNLSARQLQHDGLVADVAEVLATTGLAPSRLTLEITESVLVADPVAAARVLGALKLLGVSLALDDFGTGYSSLSYLRTLPFDMIKIARPFVEGAARHPQEASFVKMMLELGRTLGMKVVAEGIETQGQLDFVRGLECDLGQGFLLGRPDRPGEIERLLDIDAQARSARIARVA